jgi:hypothetical protein
LLSENLPDLTDPEENLRVSFYPSVPSIHDLAEVVEGLLRASLSDLTSMIAIVSTLCVVALLLFVEYISIKSGGFSGWSLFFLA